MPVIPGEIPGDLSDQHGFRGNPALFHGFHRPRALRQSMRSVARQTRVSRTVSKPTTTCRTAESDGPPRRRCPGPPVEQPVRPAGSAPPSAGRRDRSRRARRRVAPGRPGPAGGPPVEDQPQAEHAPLGGRHHGVQACSTLTGSVSVGEPEARATAAARGCRPGGPGRSKATLRSTLAVLRPTPGSVTRSAIRVGTSPPNRSTHGAWPCRAGCGSWPGRTRSVGSAPRPPRPGRRPATAASGNRAKSAGRGPVHPLVGALGREDGGGQELEGVGVVEGAQLGGGAREQHRPAARWPRGPGRPGCGVGPWPEVTGRFCADGRACRRGGADVAAPVDPPSPTVAGLLGRADAAQPWPAGLSEARRAGASTGRRPAAAPGVRRRGRPRARRRAPRSATPRSTTTATGRAPTRRAGGRPTATAGDGAGRPAARTRRSAAFGPAGGGTVRLWVDPRRTEPTTPGPRPAGFRRRAGPAPAALPAPPAPAGTGADDVRSTTRPFRVGRRRGGAGSTPEQPGLRRPSRTGPLGPAPPSWSAEAEPWFDPDGFRGPRGRRPAGRRRAGPRSTPTPTRRWARST